MKVENSLKDYLSCCVIETKNLNQITILQPHLINKLLDKFGNEVLRKRICRTPEHQDLILFDLIKIRSSSMGNYKAVIVQVLGCSSI